MGFLGSGRRATFTKRLLPSVITLCSFWRLRVTGVLRGFMIYRRLPIFSIVVLLVGLTSSVLRILTGNPKKGTTMEKVAR